MNELSQTTRYRIDLAFHGVQFHGWQRQPGYGPCKARVSLKCGYRGFRWQSSGRGHWSGPHRCRRSRRAYGCALRFAVERRSRANGRPGSAALPEDISVHRVIPVGRDFHARYSAVARTYVYRIDTRRTPFGRDRSWRIPRSFDITGRDKTRRSGYSVFMTFTGFCRAASRRESMACDVHDSRWARPRRGSRITLERTGSCTGWFVCSWERWSRFPGADGR